MIEIISSEFVFIDCLQNVRVHSIGARTSMGLRLGTELQHMRDVSEHVVPGAHITSLTLINFLHSLYSFELFSCATHYHL